MGKQQNGGVGGGGVGGGGKTMSKWLNHLKIAHLFKTTYIVFYNNISAGHTSLLQVYRCY